MDGKCEMFLLTTSTRCGEPAVFSATSNIPEVADAETGDGEFCFAHAVRLASHFLDDGRPEFRIVPLRVDLELVER